MTIAPSGNFYITGFAFIAILGGVIIGPFDFNAPESYDAKDETSFEA